MFQSFGVLRGADRSRRETDRETSRHWPLVHWLCRPSRRRDLRREVVLPKNQPLGSYQRNHAPSPYSVRWPATAAVAARGAAGEGLEEAVAAVD